MAIHIAMERTWISARGCRADSVSSRRLRSRLFTALQLSLKAARPVPTAARTLHRGLMCMKAMLCEPWYRNGKR